MESRTLESMASMRLMREVAEKLPGHAFPDNYVVFDTETTGVHTATAKIVQIGICIVVGRQAMYWFSQLIKRPNLVIPKEASDVHGITIERLEADGVPAREYIPELVKTMQAWVDSGMAIVGHNLYKFDIPLFQIESAEFGEPFRFEKGIVIDTGMLVKAAQLGSNIKPDESLRGFYNRVAETRSKVKWSLDKHCYDTYDLIRSGVTRESAHDAAADCRLTHCLLETLRQRVEK